MDAVESAIRNALARGDVRDRKHRENVYRQVFAALEKSISTSPQLAPDLAQQRRETLKLKITQIEQEFIPALPREPEAQASAQAAPVVQPPKQAVRKDSPQENAAPSVDPSDRRAGEGAPPVPSPVAAQRTETARLAGEASLDGDGADLMVEPEQRVRRRRGWPRLLILATVLAALLIGAYWVVSTGILGKPDQRVANPPAPAEDYSPPGSDARPPAGASPGEAARDWLAVFRPDDPASVAATAGARAEVMRSDGENFMRIRSTQPGAAIAFDIKQGVLERLAGTKAVFDLSARAEEGKETQISITCNFGTLGNCGRRRYIVGHNRGDYLFEIELPQGRPRGVGTIMIVTDVENTGRAIDVFEIRVSSAAAQ